MEQKDYDNISARLKFAVIEARANHQGDGLTAALWSINRITQDLAGLFSRDPKFNRTQFLAQSCQNPRDS